MGADEVQPGQVITPERTQAARQRAERISADLAAGLPRMQSAAAEYAQAVAEEDWTALGQAREDWHAALFGEYRFTVEARRQVNQLLSARGLSTRSIARATGTPRATVHRDVSQSGVSQSGVSQSGTPAVTSGNVTPRHTGPERKSDAQRARESRDRKRQRAGSGQDVRADFASLGTAPQQPSAPREETAVPGKPPATGDSIKPPSAPGLAPCRRCPDLEAEVARLREQVADLTAQLDKRPAPAAATELLTAELEFVAADRDRLAARVRELEGENARLRERLPAAQDAPEPAGPAPGPPAPGKAPDSRQESAGGVPEPPGPCGGRDTDRVQVVVAGRRLRIRAPDGTEIEWLCRAHQRELAGRIAGAQILPAPGSENDLWEFRYGTCQFRSRAVVAA